MNKKLVSILSILSLCVSITGCSARENKASSNNANKSEATTYKKTESIGSIDTYIKLSDNQTSIEGEGVTIENNKITITSAGTYSLSGTLSDGQVIVNTSKDEKVYLVLDGVNITCSNSAPIYVMSSKKTVIALVKNSQNYVKDGENYLIEDTSTNEPNAAIFSKEDLIFIGEGTLEVSANYNNGITSKDDLLIEGGKISVKSVHDGIRGKDSIVIADGQINISSEGDAIKSNNTEDVTKGYITIEGGSIDITSGEDAIQAETNATINNGEIKISSGGGSENSSKSSNDKGGAWGEKPKGERPQGEAPQIKEANPKDIETENTVEEVSAKGIKAGVNITINGGNINIDSSDDSIHTNDSVVINGGNINVASGDDGIHSDATLEINGGEIDITKSYEGIESEVITINDGKIYIVASDDGINAAGGNDGSSVNGRSGENKFASSSSGKININGGYTYVNAGGDGIDANGSIEMTNGIFLVDGPENNGNGALDYDTTFDISGGTLVAAGSAGMVQTPSSSSTQNIISINLESSQEADTLTHIQSENGEEILTYAPSKKYQSIIVSSPNIKSKTSYKIYTGGSSTGTSTEGLYKDGNYTKGKEIGSVTILDTITSLGTSMSRENGFKGGRMGKPSGTNMDGGKMEMPTQNKTNINSEEI